MSKWIEIRTPLDMPTGDELFYFTLEHADGGRRVKLCKPTSIWHGLKAIAYMHAPPLPEPFGGERLPISPARLESYLIYGLSPTAIAKQFGFDNVVEFSNVVRRYPKLYAIYTDKRYEAAIKYSKQDVVK